MILEEYPWYTYAYFFPKSLSSTYIRITAEIGFFFHKLQADFWPSIYQIPVELGEIRNSDGSLMLHISSLSYLQLPMYFEPS